jgi:hypothetical protein
MFKITLWRRRAIFIPPRLSLQPDTISLEKNEFDIQRTVHRDIFLWYNQRDVLISQFQLASSQQNMYDFYLLLCVQY